MSSYLIKRLVLHGNRRLLTKKTMTIDYAIEEDLQVILGGNGYGKSTIFDELSPLPAIKKNYIKGGYKEIHMDANGCNYVLRSSFKNNQNHHEFLRNGEELNDGHTLPVQKALVEKEFGYTQDIHRLLTGKVMFTDMDPTPRKEWLAKLSPASVDFAMGLFKQLAGEIRNTVGAIKNLKEKHFDAQRDVLSAEELTQMELQIETAQKEIGEWHKQIRTVDKIPDTEYRIYQNFTNHIDQLKSRINNCIGKLSTNALELDVIDRAQSDTQNQIMTLEATMRMLSDEYHNLKDTIADLDWSDGRDSAEIQKEIESDLGEMQTLEQCFQMKELVDQFTNPAIVVEMITENDLASQFNHALHDLMPNPNLRHYSRDILESIRETHMRVTNERTGIRNQISLGREKLKEAKEQPELVCPNCTHSFTSGHLDPVKIELYLEKKGLEEDELTTQLEELNGIIQSNVEWINSMNRVDGMMSTYGPLTPFWNWVSDSGALLDNPQSLVGKLDLLTVQLKNRADYLTIRDRVGTNQEILKMRAASEQRSMSNIKSRLTYLEEQIEHTNQTLKQSKELLDIINSDIEIYNTLYAIGLELQQTYDAYKKGFEQDLKESANSALWNEINSTTQKVGHLSKTLTSSTAKLAVLQHIEANLKELEEKLTVDKLLLENISPTTGLIADVLMGFIKEFVRQANLIKDKFWTTKLEVLPCNITNNGLDYKFPIKSESNEYPTDDVRNGSMGEVELMNFLFMMVARNFMDINHFPLFLDEVGARFHENNRSRLYQYIKMLVGSGAIKQVFVISHFESTYRTLSHAQMNVVDPTGLLVDPAVHNLHFKLKAA